MQGKVDVVYALWAYMRLEESNRKMLFEGIHSAIRNHGGIMTVYYTMDLELARKPARN